MASTAPPPPPPPSSSAPAAGAASGADRHLIASIGDEVRTGVVRVIVRPPRSPSLTIYAIPGGNCLRTSTSPHRPIAAHKDTITGMLLAGTGHVSEKGKKNFLVVDSS